MKEKLFIVGDIHGEYQLLEKLLKHWREEEEQLVFLGDLADRGPDSQQVFLKVKELVDSKGAVCLKGNHELMLLNWLENPEAKFNNYVMNGGRATLESLFYPGVLEERTSQQLAADFKEKYADLVAFLKWLPLYYETDFAICVHAGINLDLDDWRQTEPTDFVWMREAFFNHDKSPEKLVVFGHTPVQYLHQDPYQSQVWYRHNKLDIDGGAAYEGALHGVLVSASGLEADYQIFHPNRLWH